MAKLTPFTYVLATKWSDGAPMDHWVVGWFISKEGDRYMVVDNKGRLMRSGGFRRAQRISREVGDFLIWRKEKIEMSGRSLWWWKKYAKERVAQAEADRRNDGKGLFDVWICP